MLEVLVTCSTEFDLLNCQHPILAAIYKIRPQTIANFLPFPMKHILTLELEELVA